MTRKRRRAVSADTVSIEKKLDPKDQEEYDAESARIRENAKTPGAEKPHKFSSAKWTHPNGHPLCLVCGAEESMSGVCNALKALEEAVGSVFDKLDASTDDWDAKLNRAREEVLSRERWTDVLGRTESQARVKSITGDSLSSGGKLNPARLLEFIDDVPSLGLIVSQSTAEAIVRGETTMYVNDKPLRKLGGSSYLLLSERMAYGTLALGKMVKTDDGSPSYAWPITDVAAYSEPYPTNAEVGPQTTVEGVVVSDIVDVAKIKDVEAYDPSEVSDAVLRDDFHTVLMWHANLKKNPDFKHSLEILQRLLRAILKEAVRRGPDVITFHPSGMERSVRLFFFRDGAGSQGARRPD